MIKIPIKPKDKYIILGFIPSLIACELHFLDIFSIFYFFEKIFYINSSNYIIDILFEFFRVLLFLFFYVSYLPGIFLIMCNEYEFHIDIGINSITVIRIFSFLFYISIYVIILYRRNRAKKFRVQ
jgi:hypothetical protein